MKRLNKGPYFDPEMYACLHRIMKDRGWTQGGVSSDLGFSPSYLSLFVGGMRPWPADLKQRVLAMDCRKAVCV